jgi:hypothetical protein
VANVRYQIEKRAIPLNAAAHMIGFSAAINAAETHRIMPRHEVHCALAYMPEQLFDLAADVERYPEFLPWWVAIGDIVD